MPQLNNINLWLLFLPFFAIFLITTRVMGKLAKGFYTAIPPGRPFSIFNLEFPGSDEALTSLILRMDKEVKKKVRKNLLVNYLFMLGVYPGIAILCFIASSRVYADSPLGSNILQMMGIAQVIPWLCDIIENAILLKKLQKPTPPNPGTYKVFKWIVGIKFFVALIAVTSTIFIMLYIWLIGGFPVNITLIFSGLVAAFIVLMLVKAVIKHYKRRKKERLAMAIAQSL